MEGEEQGSEKKNGEGEFGVEVKNASRVSTQFIHVCS